MKIICIGRNYAKHARELGNEVPDQPVVFLKPSTALLIKDRPLYYPDFTEELHYEGELVLRISRLGKCIDPCFAHRYYDAVTVGIDFTARDLQRALKNKGLPWEIAKGWDHSAAIGRWIPIEKIHLPPDQWHFELRKNDTVVQQAQLSDMLWDIPALISYVSQYFTLHIGDMLFTGTPPGVGPVQIGDVLEGYFLGRRVLRTEIK